MMKRLFFLVVPLLVVAGLVVGGYFLFRTPPVDPATLLPEAPVVHTPIAVLKTAFLPGANDSLDVMLQLQNSNERVGAESFTYTLKFLDESAAVVFEQTEDSYILPAETKYVTSLGNTFAGVETVKEVQVFLNDAEWKEIEEFTGISLVTKGREFQATEDGRGVEVVGTIANSTSFDFRRVKVNVILFDDNDKVIGINATVLDDVKSNSERFFQATWFRDDIQGNVRGLQTSVETNFYDAGNFLTNVGSRE